MRVTIEMSNRYWKFTDESLKKLKIKKKLPLLENLDSRKVIGIVKNAKIVDGKLEAEIEITDEELKEKYKNKLEVKR